MEERNEQTAGEAAAGAFLKQGPSIDLRESIESPELKLASSGADNELLPLALEKDSRASVKDLTKAMPSQPKVSKEEEAVEPLKMLPRAGLGLFYAFAASLLIAITVNAIADFTRMMLLVMPFQIYFVYCMTRLSDVAALKQGTKSVLSPFLVTFLAIVSLACFPMFGDSYHFISRLMDPFFYVWTLAQCAWPLLLSLTVERRLNWHTLFITSIAALPFVVMSNFPLTFNVAFLFLVVWTFSQFVCVCYLMLRLRQKFADDLRVFNAKLAAVRAQVAGVSREDIVVAYKPFAAIERWLRQRFTADDSLKGTQVLFFWLSVPVIIVALLFGLQGLDWIINNSFGEHARTGKAAAQAAATLNFSFLGWFVSVLSVMILTPLFLYLRAPTHLVFNRSGLRFLWRHGRFSLDGKELRWKDLDSIKLERSLGATQALDQYLCFKARNGQVHKMKLSAFETAKEREKILAMIRNWAPNVPRPPEVEQCLEPPANHSYTEMWLQALAAPPKRERLKPLMEGASVQAGKYRVLSQLGVGGQGAAYLANDNIDEHVVVLKEFILPVHVDVNVRKSALESFENEARILKQMDSQNVVQLIDFFVEDHRAYLVLEHIDGMSLRELVEKNGAMKESQVKELAIQMCSILAYLHSLSPPVVHRDFTPDNLILQRDGTLKLIDFNVAQQVEATVTGTVVGKHAYLPPEQFRGMPTSGSDIYACGATLHFLLTGADPEPISQSHPGEKVTDLSNGMDHIVAHATHLDVGQRYDRIDEMANDLKNLT